MENKKGTLGLDIVAKTIAVLMIISVLVVALFLALTSLSSENVISRRTISGVDLGNETISLNYTGDTPASLVGRTSVTLTNIVVTNVTDGEVLESANYSQTAGLFLFGIVPDAYNGTSVNVSGTYQHTVPSNAVVVTTNVTQGAGDFFDNIPTVFTLLGIVVIILAIVLIVNIVGRREGNGI